MLQTLSDPLVRSGVVSLLLHVTVIGCLLLTSRLPSEGPKALQVVLVDLPDGRAGTGPAGGVTYTFLERATASVSVLYVGQRQDQDFSTFPFQTVTLESYTKVDLALSVLLLEDEGVLNKLQAKVKIDNLFDEDYEEAFGFPAPGLVYLFGLEATF